MASPIDILVSKPPHPDPEDFWSGQFSPLPVGEGRVRVFVLIGNNFGKIAT